MENKCCNKCNSMKPLDAFTKETRNGDGHSAACKACQSQWRKDNKERIRRNNSKWLQAHPDKASLLDQGRKLRLKLKYDADPSKACEKSRAWRALNKSKVKLSKRNYASKSVNRNKIRALAKNWRDANKDKSRIYSALYYVNNSDAVKARVRAWQNANPELKRLYEHARRALLNSSNGKLSKGLTKKLALLQHGKCACCGLDLHNDYHLDHIMPLALGGANTDENIQLLHARCNASKKDKHPIDFMRQRGFLL